MKGKAPFSWCTHCQRPIVWDFNDGWVDPEAQGADAVWRTVCDTNDTLLADHEPEIGIP